MNELKLKKSRFLSVDREVDITLKSIDTLKSEGYDAVEPISGTIYRNIDTALDNAKRIKERLDEQSMECSCYSLAVNMLSNPNAKDLLRKTVDLASAMGAPYLHHTMELTCSYKNLPVYQQVEPVFVEISREIAEYAGEKGITCIYEDQGYLINTPDRLDSLISKVNMKNTGVCLDVGNSLFYDIPAEEYAGKFAKLTKNVHIKDYLRRTTCPGVDKWSRTIQGNYLYDCPIGHGVVDFEKIFTILLRNGYDGYFSIEGIGHHDRAVGTRLALEGLQYYYDLAKSNID